MIQLTHRMPPLQSETPDGFCMCKDCRKKDPNRINRSVPRRTCYRHNPGGKKAAYALLAGKGNEVVDRISTIPNVPRPEGGTQKRRNVEIEDSPHRSKRAAGSGSVCIMVAYMRLKY